MDSLLLVYETIIEKSNTPNEDLKIFHQSLKDKYGDLLGTAKYEKLIRYYISRK